MPRKTAYVGISYLTGLLLASFFSLWLSFSIGSLFLALAVSIFVVFRPKSSDKTYRFAVGATAFAVGIFIYSGYDAVICKAVTDNDGHIFSGDITISDVNVYSSDGAFYIGKCTYPNGVNGKIGFFDNNTELIRGDKINLTGKIYLPHENGFYSSREYYRSINVFAMLETEKVNSYTIKETNIFRSLSVYRQNVIDIIRKYVPTNEGELIIGMLFGNSEWNMPAKTERMMYKAGIGHISAVSGMHMSIAAGIVSAVAAITGLSKKMKLAAVAFSTTLFMFTAGFSVSVTRSFIMIIFVYAAEIFNRKSDALTSLCVSVILLTITSPFTVRSASFLLSVSGVFGTAVLAPIIIEEIEKKLSARYYENYRINALLSSLITCAGASAAVFPVSVLCFDEISVVSIFANLILSPLFSLAVVISIAGAVMYLFAGSLCGGLFLAAGIICRPILLLSDYIGNLSFATIPTGLDIVKPLIILIIISTALSGVILNDKFYTSVIALSCVFISICCITVYRLIPTDYAEITVLTEGSGCIVIVKNNTFTTLYDLCGSKNAAAAAHKHLVRSGGDNTCFVVLTEKCEYMSTVYSELLDNPTIISPLKQIGLTYCGKNNIIKIGDITAVPSEEYMQINVNGADIICINKKTELDKDCDLCIYNCIADVYIDAPIYAVTNSRFSGEVSPFATVNNCETCEYIAYNGTILIKEDISWLR